MRDSFIFYRSYYEAINELPPENQVEVYKTLFEYALNGTEPNCTGLNRCVFTLIKPTMDKNLAQYNNGKQGGRPKKDEAENNPTETQPKPNNNLITTQQKPINIPTETKCEKVETQPHVYPISTSISSSTSLIQDVISYLNNKAKTNYKYQTKVNQLHIGARIKDGFKLEDFKTVIDKKISEWKGTDYEKFLRPETLFGSKFESYLNAKITTNKKESNNPFVDDLKSEFGGEING